MSFDKFHQPVDGIEIVQKASILTPDMIALARERVMEGEPLADVALELALAEVDATSTDEELEEIGRNLRTAESVEGPLHEVADSYESMLMVKINRAFNAGRRVIRPHLEVRNTKTVAALAARAIRDDLQETLPPILRRMYIEGGQVAAGMLQQVKTLEFNPDQPRDEQGQWTSGGGSALQELSDLKRPPAGVGTDALIQYYNAVSNPISRGGELAGMNTNQAGMWTTGRAAAEKELEGVDFGRLMDTGVEETIDISSIRSYQTWVGKNKVEESLEKMDQVRSKPLGVILRVGDTDWLVDGNHRTAAAVLSGDKTGRFIRINPSAVRGPAPVSQEIEDAYEAAKVAYAKQKLRANASVVTSTGVEYEFSVIPEHWFDPPPELRTAKREEKPKISMEFEFDRKTQAAIDWADQHAAEMIDNISETSREAINNAVAEFLETGDYKELYDEILDAVGDPERAKLIARHEPMVAVHEGQREAWRQAVKAGLLIPTATRQWIVVGDDKVCPVCEELDGATAKLGRSYKAGGQTYSGPPAHIKCRCSEGIIG